MAQIDNVGERDVRDPQTYAIIGAAMEVHRILGPGFLELVYQSAFEAELQMRGIPYAREFDLSVSYKGTPLGVCYRADFICFGDILVELKALNRLSAIEEAQVVNYLVASKLGRGVLVNFGTSSLQYRRFVGPAFQSSASVSSVKSVDPVGRKP